MKYSQSVAASAANAAAANANYSKESPKVQVEVLGVSRTTFDLLSEKLPCRCNLPAQDCVRLLRQISQHLGRVSNCCGSAPSLAMMDRHRVLLHLDVHQKG